MIDVKENKDGVVLNVWVQTRSSKSGLAGVRDNALKIKVCSPSQEGRANREIIELLAKLFGISKSKVSILSGKTSRQKRILFYGANRDDILNVLNSKI